jgi:hypothetical protein
MELEKILDDQAVRWVNGNQHAPSRRKPDFHPARVRQVSGEVGPLGGGGDPKPSELRLTVLGLTDGSEHPSGNPGGAASRCRIDHLNSRSGAGHPPRRGQPDHATSDEEHVAGHRGHITN